MEPIEDSHPLKNLTLTPEGLARRYANEKHDDSSGFHPWESVILKRILHASKDDEEALVLIARLMMSHATYMAVLKLPSSF